MRKNTTRRTIRKFLALFFTISAINGILSDYENDVPAEETIGGVIIILLINYFLLRPFKKTNDKVNENNNFESDVVDLEDLNDEIQADTQEVNENQKRFKGRNPVNDKQSLLSKIFQGRTDRY